MTEIQNPKPSHHLKKKNSKYVWVIEYWNLRFICNFSFGVPTLWAGPRFGAWDLGFGIFDSSVF